MSITGTHKAGIKANGYQQLTVSTTAVGLTIPAGSIRASIGVEAQSIRWRDDGTDPTATVGTLQKGDTFFDVVGPETLKAFKAIRDGGTDGILNISYYK